MSREHTNGNRIPTRLEGLKFRLKTRILQIKRLLRNASERVPRHFRGNMLAGSERIAETRTRLWTETSSEERFLVAGKIQNLRLAAAQLNGLEVPAGKTFSFWKQIGRASTLKGYVPGRELREGCIIPNVGGGLCQLSNALYDAAVKANFEIVERHAHTQVIAGSLAEQDRDATVFWNYVDLRFRSPTPFRIEAALNGDHLSVSFRGKKVERPALHKLTRGVVYVSEIGSCASCGLDDCFRSLDPTENADFGRTAFLVDEYAPEFDEYISGTCGEQDDLFLPIDGQRFRKGNYAWATGGFHRVRQSFLTTAVRSYRSRKLAAQGAKRQQNLLAMYERLAADYAKKLTFDVLHLVVQQNLLPYLWKSGVLGGRTFDVLMMVLPMNELQSRLDEAAKLQPESKTLGDFRADAALVEAESAALASARKVITPHTAVASLFGQRAELLAWNSPESVSVRNSRQSNPCVIFPASTVGRKGCYELREAIRGLDIELVVLGPIIEHEKFWDGFSVARGGEDWLDNADLVVLPAFIEHRPRRLLMAAAAGVPVIASSACGVEGVLGITVIDAGDIAALRKQIVAVIDKLH